MTERDPLLQEREKTHGSFEANASCYMRMRGAFYNSEGFGANPTFSLAVDMIFLKLARLRQNPNFNDHWDDIAGYAKLASEACKK